MTANFSQADAGLKDMISNIRSFGKAAEFAGESGSKSVSKFIKEMSEIDSKAITTQQRLSAMSTVLKEQEMWYNRMGASAKKAFGQELQASIEEARKKVAQYNAELQGVGAGGDTGSGFGSFGVTKGMIAYQAIMKIAQLSKQAAQYAIDTNMEFEQSNANLAAVLGTTRDNVKDLTEQAKKLGASTQYTAGEIVGLQTELARLGFLQSQIKAMTEDVTNLSIATGIDLSRAANIAGSTLRSFALPASEAERVASALAVSTTKSALTMETLSTSLPYAASQAKQFGFTIEDTLALLGTLANAGFKASNQGMAVRNIMAAIANDSSKLSRAMGMPIKTLDDFVEGLKKMKAEGANLNDIASIIEVRVGPALSRFVDAADDIKDLRDQLNDCTEEFDAMTAEMKNTAKFAKTEMKSAWDSLMLTFDNSNGVLKHTYEWFTKILNKWIEFRKMRQGGDSAISIYEKGIRTEEAKAAINAGIDKYSSKEKTPKTAEGKLKVAQQELAAATAGESENIARLDKTIAFATEKMDKYYLLNDELKAARRGGDVERADYIMREMEKLKRNFYLRYDGEGSLPIIDITKLPEFIGGEKDKKAISQAIIDHFAARVQGLENAPGAGAGYRDKYSKAETGQLTPSEQYKERIEKALDHYQVALNKAAIEYENGMYGEKDSNKAKAAYTKKREDAEKQLFSAYSDVVAEMRREAADVKTLDSERAKMLMLIEEYLPNIKNEALMSGALAKEYAELKDLIEKEKEAERERLRQLQAQRALDDRTLNALTTVAKRNGKNMSAEQLGGQGVMEYFGLSGIKDRMRADLTLDITDKEWLDLVDEINEKLAALKLPKIELDVETGTVTQLTNQVKDMATMWGYATSAVSSLGSALQNIEDPGAKVAGIVANAVASVAMGFATASAASSKYGVLPWIAASAAGLANMTAMIASIKQVTAEYHAEGGIVGMGPFISKGTDTVPAMLTPGEEVLSLSDPRHRNNLAKLQPARGYGDIQQSQPYVSGEQIWLGVNNYLRRTGRGEIVTAR